MENREASKETKKFLNLYDRIKVRNHLDFFSDKKGRVLDIRYAAPDINNPYLPNVDYLVEFDCSNHFIWVNEDDLDKLDGP